MTFVERFQGEPFDSLVRRFRAAFNRSGLRHELRLRRHAITRAERRRLKAATAARLRERAMQRRFYATRADS